MSNGFNAAQKLNTQQELQYYDVSDRSYHRVKRILDIIIASVATLVLLIPMAILMLLIYIDDPGKVLFAQNRIGKDGKLFRIFKLRTMVMETPENLSAAEFRDADKYVTHMGNFLRKTSLDELPQLINVLKGDMSIVGPRPLIAEESRIHMLRKRYGVYQTRPGITGLAQINGRNNISATKKVWWEVQYLKNFGFLTDLKILLATIPKTLCGADVSKNFNK